MSDCFFCGVFVGEENGDGGCKGRTIGNKDVCEQCLAELKHWLNGTIPRSPSMRTIPLEKDTQTNTELNTDDEIVESTDDSSTDEESDSDPFSASPKE